jgi:hypothetical protein
MITLTPDEADAYKRGGLFEAMKVFRGRTGLGLVESKRAIELWVASSGKVEGLSEVQKRELDFLEKLQEASARAQKAERALREYKWASFQVALQVANKVAEQPEPEQNTYGRACHEIIRALEKLKKGSE